MKLSKVKRICPICGIEFAPKTINSRYCSDKCSRKAYKRKVAEEKRQKELNAIAESVPDNRPTSPYQKQSQFTEWRKAPYID